MPGFSIIGSERTTTENYLTEALTDLIARLPAAEKSGFISELFLPKREECQQASFNVSLTISSGSGRRQTSFRRRSRHLNRISQRKLAFYGLHVDLHRPELVGLEAPECGKDPDACHLDPEYSVIEGVQKQGPEDPDHREEPHQPAYYMICQKIVRSDPLSSIACKVVVLHKFATRAMHTNNMTALVKCTVREKAM
jgi:hypothetical protein